MFIRILLPLTLLGALAIAQETPDGSKQALKLPEGPAKAVIERACADCHSLSLVLDGHTPGDWKLLVDRMYSDGAQIEDGQIGMIADYLAKNFPEKGYPKGVVIPGPAKVTFQEWDVPTRGARPHDPLAAPDGSIWYSGHYGNVLGHINPKTGEIKEFHPPLAHSGPHGLVMDKDGKVWFTGNFKGYIGKLDPKTGEFSEYKLPAEARDPHTPIFDQKGTLWFSVQQSNLIGRLIPSTGEIKLAKVPTAKALPYGMVVDSKGTIWCVEYGAPKIVSVDPNTMAMTEYPLLHPESRPRRIAIAADDTIYFADFPRGYIGRLDPKNGKVTEWASPSGPKSQPYGMSVINGVLWYSESHSSPNTLVRFDPKAEKFQTWAIPNGGGVVRNMMATKDGNLVMALSGINKMALATVAK